MLPTNHACAKGLRATKFSIDSYVAIATRIMDSQTQGITYEEERNTTMAKEATDLHYMIRNMLLYVRGSKKLIEDIKELLEAPGFATAIEGAVGITSDSTADAAASATDADTSKSV
jgi:hypothetical protein